MNSALCESQLNESKKPGLLVGLQNVSVVIDEKVILRDLSLQIYTGDRIALVGPSGIGKSTLLKTIAGLLTPAEGKIKVCGNVSFVFDDNKLYPLLSALENIELGVDFSRVTGKERKKKAARWASVFSCTAFLQQKCQTLSAGQRKRTALARAMMKEPQILLLDETFHALDPELRLELIDALLKLQKEMGFAIVFATHDLREVDLLHADLLKLEETEEGRNSL